MQHIVGQETNPINRPAGVGNQPIIFIIRGVGAWCSPGHSQQGFSALSRLNRDVGLDGVCNETLLVRRVMQL
jgi:hypothetical protein